MADFRMLEKLQQIRKVAWDLQISEGNEREGLRQIEKLCNEAIDLDCRITREGYKLEPAPPEADAGSWSQYQAIKARHAERAR